MRKLKRGVALYATDITGHYLVGSQKRAVRITTSMEKALITTFAAGGDEAEIAALLSTLTPAQRVQSEELIAALDSAQLCQMRQGKLALSKRFISSSNGRATKNSRPEMDAAFIQLQTRVAAELAQTNWIPGVDDGGIEILGARQDLLIEISGTSRVATIVYSLLLASGATQTRFAPIAHETSRLVGDLDIAIGSFTSNHIGCTFDKQCEVLRRELSLFPLDRDNNYGDEISTPDIRIHCGDIDPERLALWMNSDLPFMHIPTPHADVAQIGPIVIPGKSPCLRCVELAERDQSGVISKQPLLHNPESEYPVIAAYFIASLAASQVLAFFEKQSSETTGKVISLDYQALAYPQVVTIARHPLCGCAF
jgi:hypothetical protein